jgi:hypothetical protein
MMSAARRDPWTPRKLPQPLKGGGVVEIEVESVILLQ